MTEVLPLYYILTREYELLHQKLDLLREQEVVELIRLVTALEHRISELQASAARGP